MRYELTDHEWAAIRPMLPKGALHSGQQHGEFRLRKCELSHPPSDADLEKIGVSLGHRRKILAAIAELPGASPSKHEPVDEIAPRTRLAAGEMRSARSRERRDLRAQVRSQAKR